ncbi:Peptidyl-prolyl cis-trans isomerase CWC27 like protein [Eufriesea mexicana]|uniref:Spliceosome-associated protein CWC27 homolog n=1 Tax=Eufriesea mexicana TaxID=516756 RepID=A0A310SPW7_9HYME|nr:Peptidyl-prolyl cis-trans isomerase CWC27 like protein [Eufriesea mexicana]
MKTTVGDTDSELWAKETPKAYRTFIQLCMEGYWDDTILHTQDGDFTGIEEGSKIYGEKFKDEFHTGLRFCQRDLIAMFNAGKDANTSQFLFTLGAGVTGYKASLGALGLVLGVSLVRRPLSFASKSWRGLWWLGGLGSIGRMPRHEVVLYTRCYIVMNMIQGLEVGQQLKPFEEAVTILQSAII